VLTPEGVDSGIVVKELKRRFAAIVTNGQGEMKGKIFRIAHIGLFDYMDTIAIIAALEQVAATSLRLPGFAFGKALVAAQQVYAEQSAEAANVKAVPEMVPA
jgi:aspartate aminotransferase-like enzyme